IPVTAKIRSGLQPGAEVAVEVARRLADVGVVAIGVHPRAASQFYRGRADHALTAAVTAAVDVPVFASGDVDSAAAAQTILSMTRASAVMVARAAQSGPWILTDILDGVDRGRRARSEVVAELRALIALAAIDMGGHRAASWSRKIVGWYLKGLGLSVAEQDRLRGCPDADSLDTALAEIAVHSSLPPSDGVC
ncbi:MAG: tRNA-dihydrouridine synthase, partial [Thermoleophilia bacterium]